MERAATADAPPTTSELFEPARGILDSSLADGWNVEIDRRPRHADARLRLTAPDGRSATLIVEAKCVVDARDVPAVSGRLRLDDDQPAGGVLVVEAKCVVDARDVPAVSGRLRLDDDQDAAGGLVVARYLSPRAREALIAAGVSYVDATGNVRIVVGEPAVFVLMRGANSDPWRSPERPTSSLRGRPVARIVRALVDLRPPWKVRELAQAAGASLGSTAHMLDLLSREALVERDGSGAIVGVDWSALLDRWAADYNLVKRRRIVRLLAARGLEAIEDALRTSDDRYAISGSMAAARWAPYAEARLALIYAQDVEDLRSRLGLREPPSRPNVVLIEPDDDYVFERMVEREELWLAAPSQVAVDLLAGPGRNPEEGRALIEWMAENEGEWRRQ